MILQSGDFRVCQRRRMKQIRFYVQSYQNSWGKSVREWHQVEYPTVEHIRMLPQTWLSPTRDFGCCVKNWVPMLNASNLPHYLRFVMNEILLPTFIDYILLYIAHDPHECCVPACWFRSF
jgi:hypothetical protein